MEPAAHVPDEELAMYLDAELADSRMREVRQHLADCTQCRSRLSEFEHAAAEFLSSHRTAAGQIAIPPAAGPTARLKASMRAAAAPAAVGDARFARPAWILCGIAAVLLAPIGLMFWLSEVRMDPAGPLPDARLTPGAVRQVSRQQVCEAEREDEGKLVSPEIARRVFQRYRIENPRPRAYEVDYLVSPALGGAIAPENLWPVPYAEGEWTSRVKDALEDRLRAMVCAGEIELTTAQREITSNWIAAYRKHFRSRRPLAAHAHFVKDSPWE